MGDNLPTVWDASPHTIAKHAILREYLAAWFPILSRQSAKVQSTHPANTKNEILFIDAFAGPGEYANGEPGSPIIALKGGKRTQRSFPGANSIALCRKGCCKASTLEACA